MATKDEYIAKLKAQLDEWKEDIEHLGNKAADASEDVKAKIETQIAELKAKWDEGEGKRQEILAAADDKWEDMKDEAEERWSQITGFVKVQLDKIKSHFS